MNVQENVPMSSYTSCKVGGPARYFVKTESKEDLLASLEFAKSKKIPYFVLGNGTNLLISDKGFNGLIIVLGKSFSEIQDLGNGKFQVGAAASLGSFARKTIKWSMLGLHKLGGIPGTLGGAIYMNAGAYGVEIANCCTQVNSIDVAGNLKTRTGVECNFGYRKSIFQEISTNPEAAEIILSATFQLSPGDTAVMEQELAECMAKRKATQPLNKPNAGSTFKRLEIGAKETPQQIAPGYYIEQAGLKGFRMGGAEVSTLHANFIVNAGGATASDIKNLSEYIQKVVAKKFGVQLKREIILLGEF